LKIIPFSSKLSAQEWGERNGHSLDHYHRISGGSDREILSSRGVEPMMDAALGSGLTNQTCSGSLAIFAAIRRASSLVSSLAADRRPGSSSQ